MSDPDADPDPAAEPVAVYDAAGAVVGVATRGEVYARSLWHGVGGVLLRSGDGERVYVHRRSATKLVMPGLHDCWAGGVVGAGEDPAATTARVVHGEQLGGGIARGCAGHPPIIATATTRRATRLSP